LGSGNGTKCQDEQEYYNVFAAVIILFYSFAVTFALFEIKMNTKCQGFMKKYCRKSSSKKIDGH